MYRAVYLTSMDDLSALKRVRAGIEELRAQDGDARDALAVYALAFDEADAPCGCGRMYIDGASHFRIDQLGVLKSHRGRYIGDLLARMLLYRAERLNAASVYAQCPIACAGFFARYGFRPIADGAPQAGGDIAMFVPGGEIVLEGKCRKPGARDCPGDCDNCADR